MKNRTLYFGDNLEILRDKIPDEIFDLIYLDPPFNSNRNYNVLFKEGIQDSPAQVQAFEDSWHWTEEAQKVFEELVGVRKSKTKINEQISNLMLALEKLVGHNDMLAYLIMMTVRLIELKRVLKPTGSIYVHCDSTASHYLKLIMDTVFGKQNFRNEIVWKRTHSHNDPKRFGRNTDKILFYTKTDEFFFKTIYSQYDQKYIDDFFRHEDKNGKYQLVVLTGMGVSRGESDTEWKGYKPSQSGRHWSVPKRVVNKLVGEAKASKLPIKEKLDLLFDNDYIVVSKNGIPRFKQYLNEMEGAPAQELWDDILVIGAQAKERLGYPTQKPEALLERIIKASSKEGDLVLDPFCGCGTTIAVAERLNRNWVGIDITMLAINLIRHRLSRQFADKGINIFVDGRPKDVSGAKALFKKDSFEFEYWALDLVSAVPAQSKTKENMRGADKGIDGVINFIKDVVNNQQFYGKLLVQVKGGAVHRNDIATLKGDIEREKADGGLFITLEKPTAPMKTEAVQAGSYTVKFAPAEFPKIQIISVEELLANKLPKVPVIALPYFKEAKSSKTDNLGQQLGI